MAYYPVSEVQLLTMIAARKPGWQAQIDPLHQANLAAARLLHKQPLWSKIKQSYTDLQFYKCAYCELSLGGSATQHLEHYRPKAKVTRWPTKAVPGLTFPTPTGRPNGYYWLTYDPTNYAVSCAHCNTSRKGTRFPIDGTAAAGVATVAQLNTAERPLLLQPVGLWGDDPGLFITFDGINAVPRAGLGAVDARRALATIMFFNLNTEAHLLVGRRRVIRLMWGFFEAREAAADEAARALQQENIDLLRSRSAPHSLCASAFADLLETDKLLATKYWEAAGSHLRSLGEPVPG